MTHEERLTESGRLYVGIVIFAGVVAVLHSVYTLRLYPISYHWLLLAGLTLLSGSFTVRIPTIPARLSVSETFVFAAVLLFGPAAATMIVVLDCLVISLWLKKRSRRAARVLFNIAAPSVAIWMASYAFYFLANIEPIARAPRPVLPLLVPLLALAVLYFLLNSILVAVAVAFEKHVSALTVWRENFMWLSLNYFSGASVAALLLPYLQPEKPEFARVIGILLPLLLISYLTFKTAMGRVDDANRHLKELNRLYLSTIETLAMAIDAKDQITHGHIRRVQIHAVALARAMGVKEEAQIRAIEAAALLHDMGKLAVPEYILNKPGPLTPAEFDKMKLHASVGADILSAIEFPYPVVPIVRHHHENWNGAGYPDGLAGTAIPIGARILSVVDCFDALTSDRPYRPRLSDREALRILAERRGQMYDPLVVDTFVQLHADGGFRTSAASMESRFVPITSSSLPSSPSLPSRADRLEDITASGEEMLALFELARGLNKRMSLADVSEMIVQQVRRLVPFSLFVFYEYDVDADELVSSYVSGEHTDLVTGVKIPLGQRLTGWVGAHRQTIRNSDPVLDLGEAARSVSPRPRSCLSTPLTVGPSLVGVFSLYSSGYEAFSEDHQRVLEVIARQVAPVVQQALVFGQSRQPPVRNPAASLPSLKQLNVLVRSHSHLTGGAMAVIYLAVVRKKRIQTQHGGEEIDDALSHVVTCAQRHIRPTDILFRYDGSSFLVVQFQTDRKLASMMADRIRHTVEVESPSGTDDVRVTMGVSVSPEDGQSVDALIAAARRKGEFPSLPSGDDLNQPPESVH